ncbi:MAG: GGDEF domain-containing protein, partial [Longimicrobiales bacterium]
MLSESTRPGTAAAYGSALLPLLHARGARARWTGSAIGVVSIALLATVLPALPPDLPITVLMLAPVMLVSWYAGVWPGACLAVAASALRLLITLGSGTAYSSPVVPYWGFAIELCLFVAAARVLPGLRDSAFRDRELAITDPLTNLGNRRLFSEMAATELNRTRRYGRPLALVYLNVDAFEKFNERQGYAEGDALLVLAASVIRGGLRTSDVVARIAADEFAVLLPETHAQGANVAAEKIHHNLSTAAAHAGYAVTFSVAVITYADG